MGYKSYLIISFMGLSVTSLALAETSSLAEACQGKKPSQREIEKIEHYIRTDNSKALAKWIRYPIRIETKHPLAYKDHHYSHWGEEINILNEQEFVIFYPRFMTTKVKEGRDELSYRLLWDEKNQELFVHGLPIRAKPSTWQKMRCKEVKSPLSKFRAYFEVLPGPANPSVFKEESK